MAALSSKTTFIAPGTAAISVAELVPGSRAPTRPDDARDLAGLDDLALLRIVRLMPRTSGRRLAACEILVTRYQGLVWSCVRRYAHGPEPAEDLAQVGYIGLLKAINNFDPAVCRSLATYAQPCITGEIKRHFRDNRWQIHVKRSVQELVLSVRTATGQLTQDLGRTPTESDLATHLGVSRDHLREARRAELAFQPSSLDAPLAGQRGTITLTDYLGEEDPRLEQMLALRTVATHWGELTPREQSILVMSFRGGLTQTEIGQRLQISQMHVSRLRADALGHLRSRLLDIADTPAQADALRRQHATTAGSAARHPVVQAAAPARRSC
jgi:RNA polymerase sigma-B factor